MKKTIDFVCKIVKTIDSVGLEALNGKTNKAPNSLSEVQFGLLYFQILLFLFQMVIQSTMQEKSFLSPNIFYANCLIKVFP